MAAFHDKSTKQGSGIVLFYFTDALSRVGILSEVGALAAATELAELRDVPPHKETAAANGRGHRVRTTDLPL